VPTFLDEIIQNPLATLLLLPFLPFIFFATALSNTPNSTSSRAELLGGIPPLPSLTESPRLQNFEEIEWEDWKGRTRRIVIHRRVE